MTDDHKALVGALHKPHSHLDCEDCWYSCATLTCDERRKGDECDCGASFSNTQRKQAAAAIESLSEQLERAEADAARYRGLRRGHEEGWALIHFLHDGPLTQVPSAIDKRVDVAIARKESHE